MHANNTSSTVAIFVSIHIVCYVWCVSSGTVRYATRRMCRKMSIKTVGHAWFEHTAHTWGFFLSHFIVLKQVFSLEHYYSIDTDAQACHGSSNNEGIKKPSTNPISTYTPLQSKRVLFIFLVIPIDGLNSWMVQLFYFLVNFFVFSFNVNK